MSVIITCLWLYIYSDNFQFHYCDGPGSDPVCSLNVSSENIIVTEHDRLQLACSVNYSGNWAPSTHCRPTSNSRRTEVTRWTATHSEHLVVTTSLNAATLSCTTLFVQSSRRRVHIAHLVVASNTPTYVHTWTSSLINVLCTPNTKLISAKYNFISETSVTGGYRSCIAKAVLFSAVSACGCVCLFVNSITLRLRYHHEIFMRERYSKNKSLDEFENG